MQVQIRKLRLTSNTFAESEKVFMQWGTCGEKTATRAHILWTSLLVDCVHWCNCVCWWGLQGCKCQIRTSQWVVC